jgi:hypothetical protein
VLYEVMVSRAIIERDRGRYDESTAELQRARVVAADESAVRGVQVRIAQIEVLRGRTDEADQLLGEIGRLSGDDPAYTLASHALAVIALARGDARGASLLVNDFVLPPQPAPEVLFWCAIARYAAYDAEGAASDLRDAIGVETAKEGSLPFLAGLFEVFAWAIASSGPDDAARAFGFAEALRERTGTVLHVAYCAPHDAAVAAMRAGSTAFDHLWADGRRLTVAAAVALVAT